MEEFERLIKKCVQKQYRLEIKFDAELEGEEWHIKFYPCSMDDAHFYAYHTSLNSAAAQLLNELRELSEW